jgi:hypothetical protein
VTLQARVKTILAGRPAHTRFQGTSADVNADKRGYAATVPCSGLAGVSAASGALPTSPTILIMKAIAGALLRDANRRGCNG